MKVGMIGVGAIATYVRAALQTQGHVVAAILVKPSRLAEDPSLYVSTVAALPADLDLVIECAGHAALRVFGAEILARGIDVLTVSTGALADATLYASLKNQAIASGAKLHLASGAIGALDCLQAARAGQISRVTYIGRKPPHGWKGSPAEQALDLDALASGQVVHFEGTARQAALEYPKNANVAAAVALAGVGFDETQVRLIADAEVTQNIHEITAEGDFGHFQFQISGNALPDNPRSSALAAMSVLSKIGQITRPITL
ncbi:MAG: aspartate dehydrogenase [Sulfitobacter sp.]